MDNVKSVMISLPDSLLKEAMKLYLKEKKKEQIREKLRNGYLEMSEFNKKLADEGLKYDSKVINYYEDSLAECE